MDGFYIRLALTHTSQQGHKHSTFRSNAGCVRFVHGRAERELEGANSAWIDTPSPLSAFTFPHEEAIFAEDFKPLSGTTSKEVADLVQW